MIRCNISKIKGNLLLVLVELSGTIGGLFGGKEKEEEKIEETGEKPVEVGSVYLWINGVVLLCFTVVCGFILLPFIGKSVCNARRYISTSVELLQLFLFSRFSLSW